jgi:hypothetical protein
MKYYAGTLKDSQGVIGHTRPRLYTIEEIAEDMGISTAAVKQHRQEAGIEPVFAKRPFKYHIFAFKEAANARAGTALYAVDKGVPIPPRKTVTSTVAPTLAELEVGDSFLVPKYRLAAFYSTAKKMGLEITGRRTAESEEIYRVWRTK